MPAVVLRLPQFLARFLLAWLHDRLIGLPAYPNRRSEEPKNCRREKMNEGKMSTRPGRKKEATFGLIPASRLLGKGGTRLSYGGGSKGSSKGSNTSTGKGWQQQAGWLAGRE